MSEVDRLPDRWVRTTVGEVANVVLGKTPKGLVESADGDIPFYKVADMNTADGRLMGRTRIYLNQLAVEHYRVRVLPPATVIFPKVGGALATNKKRVLTQAAAIDTNTMGVIPTLAVENTFLFYWFEKLDLKSIAYGAPVPQINKKGVSELAFPLPPLPEQWRIVEAIETHLSRIDAGVDNLQRAQRNIERMRASILKAAVEGRLVPQDPNEPEVVLTALDEREARPDDIGGLRRLPHGWQWVWLPEVGEVGRGKSKHRPRNDPSLYGGPFPFVQTGDVRLSNGRIRTHTQTYSEVGFAQSRLWPTGTVCITIAANIAESGLLTYPACFPDSVVGVVVDERIAIPEFIELFIRTAKQDLAAYAPATAQKNINLRVLNGLAVPLPPLAEQVRIASEVSRQLSILDAVSSAARDAQWDADRLKRSLLQAAFSGRLAPQDPADEPASVLVDRIRAAREGATV